MAKLARNTLDDHIVLYDITDLQYFKELVNLLKERVPLATKTRRKLCKC